MEAQTVLVFFLLTANLLGMLIHWLVLKNRFSRQRILSELRAEVDKLIVDLGLETDRDVELLESRVRNLRSLIEEADRRIVLAEREAEKKLAADEVLASISHVTRRTASAKPATREQPVVKKQPVTVTQSEPVTTSEPVMIYTKPRITRSEKQIEPLIPLNEKVLEMARKGISADMIAATLSVSLGEVELIVDMNRSSL